MWRAGVSAASRRMAPAACWVTATTTRMTTTAATMLNGQRRSHAEKKNSRKNFGRVPEGARYGVPRRGGPKKAPRKPNAREVRQERLLPGTRSILHSI
jgi:hypothetical protein